MLQLSTQRRAIASSISAVSHMGFAIVPQQSAFVVERLGKFKEVLEPGFHFLIPAIDKIAYTHSLKEHAVSVPNQFAITLDNVQIQIDGVLYLRVLDPYKASYNVSDPLYALLQIAQTTMRSEIGRLSLDQTFESRSSLNRLIVAAINEASAPWGVECVRYEIRDILPPPGVKQAMELQAEAERRKRAEVLRSEAERASEVNVAEGRRQAAVLQAAGEAEAVKLKAVATAQALETVAIALKTGGDSAASFRLASAYIEAFEKIAKETNTVVVSAPLSDVAGVVAQAGRVWNAVRDSSKAADSK